MHELEDGRAACREGHNLKHDKQCRQCSQLFICLRDIGELHVVEQTAAEVLQEEIERIRQRHERTREDHRPRNTAMAENFRRTYGGTEATG